MTTAMSYDGSVSGTLSYVAQLALMAVTPATDTNFLTLLPAATVYAENRLYRDLDLLATTAVSTSYTATAGNRALAVPATAFVTIQQVNVITPAGTIDPASGTRWPLTPVAKEWLSMVYGSPSKADVPAYFAMQDQNTILFGPWPNATYTVEIVGTVRPTSLSSTNQTTLLSLYFPELMLLAAMVYVSGYQRNFSGAQSNNPEMPVNYETQYQTLLRAAQTEEARKKFQGPAWASQSPPIAASPSR